MKRRGRKLSRGSIVANALILVGTSAVVAAILLRARSSELEVEPRSFCRTQARWAAESAIARARAELGAGKLPGPSGGVLSSAGERAEVRYRLDVARGGGSVVLEAEGSCTRKDDRPTKVSISAELKGGGTRWRVVSWVEPTRAELESDAEEEE